MSLARGLTLALVAWTAVGCAKLGVVSDGSSVSWGRANRGGISNPVRLPDDGDGYRVPQRWRERGLRYGTQELVGMIVAVARQVQMDWPGTPVTVADLSWESGGPSHWHRSHQSGRDVDLVFFETDEAGRPVAPEDMRRFRADGTSVPEAGQPQLVFDTARNWSMVRALVEAQGVQIQRIFIYEPLREMLLDHARAIGEPAWLIDRAGELLHQPGDSLPHDDHMHIRIMCSSEDLAYGCQDYGINFAATKKLAKLGVLAWESWAAPMRRTVLAPLPAMLSLAGFPIQR